ncbi:MAG: hypothetical protein ONB30_10265 [candidate division KSB1 bacterium]|nr:hypothetical protein [candidate division KSB1 bacterium]
MKARLVYLGAGCLALGLVLWLACGERIVGEKEGVQGAGEVSGGGRVSGRLVVPDSVPVVVDEAALARAFELRCSGIRILRLVKPDEGADEETYYVTFFEDGCGKGGWDVREHRVFAYRPGNKWVRSQVVGEVTDQRLAKASQEPPCWLLARVFKDAGYGGDDFTFSQAAGSVGYYHKVIWDLQNFQYCCDENYPGGFNDCISSHYWIEHHNLGAGMYSRPVSMKVWKDANRQGPYKNFDAISTDEGYKCFHPNYAEVRWKNAPWETINDKVSSIDMFYEVRSE